MSFFCLYLCSYVAVFFCIATVSRRIKVYIIPVAGQRTDGTTFRARKVTSQVATPGAESAVYDCLVEYSGARSLQRLVGEWIIYFSCRQTLQLAARRPQFVGSVYDALRNYSIRFLATSVHAAV